MSTISLNTQIFQTNVALTQSEQAQATIPPTNNKPRNTIELSPEQQNKLTDYKQTVIDDAILSIDQARESNKQIELAEVAIESKKAAINAYTIAAQGEKLYDVDIDDEDNIAIRNSLFEQSAQLSKNTVQFYQQIANPVESSFLSLSA